MNEMGDSLLALHQWCSSKAFAKVSRVRPERKTLSENRKTQTNLKLVTDAVREAARRMSQEGVQRLAGTAGRPSRVGREKHHPDSRAARAKAAGINEDTQKRLDYILRCRPEWLLEIADGKRAVFASYSELRKEQTGLAAVEQHGWTAEALKSDLISLCEQTQRSAYELLPLKSKKMRAGELITVKRDVSMAEPCTYICVTSRAEFDKLVKSNRSDELRTLGGKVYFAVPAGLVDKSEVPGKCGLIIRERDHWRVAKASSARFEQLIPEVLLAMLQKSTQVLESTLDMDF